MQRWGFIYTLGEGANGPERQELVAGGCTLVCVGIPTVDGARAAARGLLDEGAELIELCGAFGANGLAAVLAEVDGVVPVGAVFYGGDAAAGLQRLFG